MTYILIKPGVDMSGLSPSIWEKAGAVAAVFKRHGYDAVITSARRLPLGGFSYHHTGDALDFRAKHIPTDKERAAILDALIAACGPDYDAVLHGKGANIHYHIEYDPA